MLGDYFILPHPVYIYFTTYLRYNCHGRPQAWARGHLPTHGKVEVLSRKVSLNSFNAIGLGVCEHMLRKLNSRLIYERLLIYDSQC